MDISILLAHPNKQSFNHAIAEAACFALQKNGHRVLMHDLYAEHFDPLMYGEEFPEDAQLPPQIAAHCQEIVSVDGIIVVHPNSLWRARADKKSTHRHPVGAFVCRAISSRLSGNIPRRSVGLVPARRGVRPRCW